MYPQVFDHLKPYVNHSVANTFKLYKADEFAKPSNKPNILFAIYFLIAVGGGALRKWVFSVGFVSNLILLVLMVFPLLFFILNAKNIQSPFKQFGILYGYVALLIYHVINPYQKTLFHGMLGFLVYAPFWLGIFFLLVNRHAFNLYKLRWLFLSMAILEVALCFVQYALPPNHFLNKYAVDRDAGIAMVGNAVRVTGTFSFLSGLTAYTVFHAFLSWAIFRWRFPPWVFFSMLGAGLILCFMAGSRGGTLIYLMIVSGILWNEFPPQKLLKFIFSYILPFLIVAIIVLRLGEGKIFDTVNKAIDNFIERTTVLAKRGEQSKRLVWGLDKFDNLDNFPDPILGVGAGSTYQGAVILFGKSDAVQRFGYYESEFVQTFLEGGIVMLIFRIALILTLLRQLPFAWPLKLLLFICMIYGLPIVFNVYNAAFLLMGIALVDNTIYWQQRNALFGAKASKSLESIK
jgi:hypothetical protein